MLINVRQGLEWCYSRPIWGTGRPLGYLSFASICLLAAVTGCAPGATTPAPAPDTKAIGSNANAELNNRAAADLLQTRATALTSLDKPLGPGDSLKISVPGTDEFTDCEVRVSGQGTVNVPLIGNIQAAGLSEEAVASEITDRLKKYIRNPQVRVYVQEYRGNQVGVFGAVTRPGVYNPASGDESLQSMIAQAGGLTATAARRIEFVAGGTESGGRGVVAVSLQEPGRISIDLNDPMSVRFLSMPAHPGDVIFVPELGQVLVQGWVGKPGSYPITRGLRVLGAIAAAGGPLYAADLDAVKLVRSQHSGGKKVEAIDINAIETGETSDEFVEDADVIDVGYSNAKIVPYAVYTAFSEIFHLGAYVNPALP
jgi:polysaccharide export outer membrane protein